MTAFFRRTLTKDQLREGGKLLGLFLAAALLLRFSGEAGSSASEGLLICAGSLVPSLFPFLVLTCWGVESGAGTAAGKLLGPVVRRVLRLPESCAFPFLMAFLGGYPAGAKAAALLLERGEIDKEQAGRMLLFSVAPGPAFTVSFLGGRLLGSSRAGWLLFASVTGAGVLLSLLTAIGKPPPPKGRLSERSRPGALIRAVSGASESVVSMCSCIVLFSVGMAVLRAVLSPAVTAFPPVCSFLAEVTAGAKAAAEAGSAPALFAFGLGFGGLCVHLQVFSFFSEFPLKKSVFFLFRLLHGGLAAGLLAALIRLFPGDPVEAWASTVPVLGASPLSGTLAGGLSVLLLCLVFLIVIGQTAAEKDSA